jgi:class 3 adenylate cyclase
VTVLFCDLVGFTAASEAADPEDVRSRIRPYHARLRREIERYSGTVEKFIGDAVMAVFGAPVAHEDDAERAVRAGLRILEAIGELNEEDASLSLQVRIGINTGEAVVALGARPEELRGRRGSQEWLSRTLHSRLLVNRLRLAGRWVSACRRRPRLIRASRATRPVTPD